MKQIEVRIKIRNNLLVERRMELGWSQAEAARQIGITQQSYNGYETFRTSPLTQKRHEWTGVANIIAEFWDVPPGELWPKSLREIEKNTMTFYVEARELQLGAVRRALSPGQAFDRKEFDEAIMAALMLLKKRDREVIMMYFGIDDREPMTLDEIEEAMGISRERVRQLRDRGLRNMRENALNARRHGSSINSWLADWFSEGIEEGVQIEEITDNFEEENE